MRLLAKAGGLGDVSEYPSSRAKQGSPNGCIRVRARDQQQVSAMAGPDLQSAICTPRNAPRVVCAPPAHVLRSAIIIEPSGRTSLQTRWRVDAVIFVVLYAHRT